jgi:ethanolamine kinase
VGDDTVLCRIYGDKTEILIDRARELTLIAELHKANLGPKLFGKFQGGFVYEYIPGEALDADAVRDPTIAAQIATQLAGFHNLNIPSLVSEEAGPSLFPTLRNWLGAAKAAAPDFFTANPHWDLRAEIEELSDALSNCGAHPAFCHNDLLPGNIIRREDNAGVCFIDYEYASWNWAESDIANHFCEYMGFRVDPSLYPNEEQRRHFIVNYLRAREFDVSDADLVHGWMDRVQRFSLCAHLFWSLWALVQSSFSKIEFDFAGYARVRINMYLQLKKRLLPRH